MKTSQKILIYLETHESATVSEVSIALERSKADIREQMDYLLAQNRVERLTTAPAETPGRPAARFSVLQKTPELLIKGLVTALMGFINVNSLDQARMIELNNLITNALVANFQPCGYSSANRMNQAVSYLEAIGVRTRWIASSTGPKITLLHENISNLIRNPVLSKIVVKQLIQMMKEKAVGA